MALFLLLFQHAFAGTTSSHTMQTLLSSGFCSLPENKKEIELFNSKENCQPERKEFMLAACENKDSYLQAINLKTTIIKAKKKKKAEKAGRIVALPNGYSLILPKQYKAKVTTEDKSTRLKFEGIGAQLTLNELGQIDLVGFKKMYKVMQLTANNNFDALAEMLSRNINIDPRESSCRDLYAVRQIFLQKSILQFNGNHWRFYQAENIVLVTGAEMSLFLIYLPNDKTIWLYAQGQMPENALLSIAKSIRRTNAP